MKDVNKTVKETFFECDKHIEKINTAKRHLESIFPLSTEYYRKVTEIEASFIDQLVFRFSKLQDTLGERLFSAVLILSGEDIKRKTFMDVLNRLEELELVKRTEWLKLREIRNEIAHEYSENTDEVVKCINDIFKKSDRVIDIYANVKDFCRLKFGL